MLIPQMCPLEMHLESTDLLSFFTFGASRMTGSRLHYNTPEFASIHALRCQNFPFLFVNPSKTQKNARSARRVHTYFRTAPMWSLSVSNNAYSLALIDPVSRLITPTYTWYSEIRRGAVGAQTDSRGF